MNKFVRRKMDNKSTIEIGITSFYLTLAFDQVNGKQKTNNKNK